MGQAGSFRANALGSSQMSAAQTHEARLDQVAKLRVKRDTPPLIYSPYSPGERGEGARALHPGGDDAVDKILAMIAAKDAERHLSLTAAYDAHVAGTRRNKGASKLCLHAFVQFPTDLEITPANERLMLAQAVDFVNRHHGGRAVFHARLDRDETGQHGVDVFYAPRHEKVTRRGKLREEWVSLTKFGKELAIARFGQKPKEVKTREKDPETGEPIWKPALDASGNPVMVDCDSSYYQGQALQDLFFAHLRDRMGLDWVQRGEKKVSRDPDRIEVEEYKLRKERERVLAEIRAEAARAAQERAEAAKELADTKHALKAARALLAPFKAAYDALTDWQARRPMSPEERLEKAEAEHLAARRARRDATPAEQERRAAEFEKAEMAAKQEVAQCRAEAGLIVEFVADEGFTPGRPAQKCGETGKSLILCRDARTGERVQVYIPDVERMAAVSGSIGGIHPRVHREHASMLATLKVLRPGDFLHILKPVAHDFIEKAVRCYSMIRCDPPRYGATPPKEARPFADLPAPVQEAMKAAFEAEKSQPSPSPGP